MQTQRSDASAQTLTFIIQDGKAKDWKRVIDTSLESPDDFRDTGSEVALQSPSYVKPLGVAIFIRRTQ